LLPAAHRIIINLMVNSNPSGLDHTFAALADPTRRAILARLALGECTVGELGAPFAISAPAISKHLRQLERARLIERRRAGRTLRCRLNPAALAEAQDWIAAQRRFWTESLDRLADLLATVEGKDTP
jgi:DNA-binding transcriptional ArsR family regulator